MNYTVELNDLPCTLEEILKKNWGFSKRLIRSLKASDGAALVNNQQVKMIEPLAEGDLIHIRFPKEDRSAYMLAEYIPLNIVYEDDALLIINKRAGVAMSPSAQHSTGTLANGIIYYYDACNLPYTVHFVTRLDLDTSGIVIVAKHRYIHARLTQELQKGRIKRSYEAFVQGRLKHTVGTINEPIGRKPGSIIERMVDPLGRKSITHYQVIHQTEDYSHVAIQLETGRTHQIRVHFAHIQHALLGDRLYGGDCRKMHQQALHCKAVSFIHPQTNEIVEFQASLRKEMDAFLSLDKK